MLQVKETGKLVFYSLSMSSINDFIFGMLNLAIFQSLSGLYGLVLMDMLVSNVVEHPPRICGCSS
jgi:hypothetical protein